ncbi:MAG: hypothetical protein R3A47_01165 [Polyangiales bacterium]
MVATLAILVSSISVTAQPCPTGDACYYVPPEMPRPSGFPDTDWDIVLTSTNGGTVTGTYRFGISGTPTAFSVTGTSTVTIALDDNVGVASAYNVIESRGVFIQANGDLGVASRTSAGPWQSSALIKESGAAQGQRFRLGGYALNRENYTTAGDSGMDVVAVYAPTGAVVTFTAPANATAPFWGDGIAGLTHSVTLAAGETYLLRGQKNVCDKDFDGALVTSTSPIVVNVGGRGGAGLCGISASCGDDGMDNILPVQNWGDTFVVTNFPAADTYGERVRVVADTDGTEIKVDGNTVATIDAGEFHQLVPGAVSLIEASEPVAVFHNASNSTCELGMSYVPPMDFPGIAPLTATVNFLYAGVARITIEASRASTLRLDGAALPSPTTTPVPTRSDVVVVGFSVAAGTHTISATGDFQLGAVMASAGSTGVFAYFTPFRIPRCGNGQIDDLEGCDDANVTNGDGCSGLCRIEVGTSGCAVDAQCVPGAVCDGSGTCRECIGDEDCDDGNSCSNDACVDNACEYQSVSLGTQCAGGVCNGSVDFPQCVVCVDGPTSVDPGCPAGASMCGDFGGGLFACYGCSVNADCNNFVECVVSICNGAFICSNTPEPLGTACTGGVCNGSATAPACEPCVDDVAGSGMDTGCTVAEPFCDRSAGTAEVLLVVHLPDAA